MAVTTAASLSLSAPVFAQQKIAGASSVSRVTVSFVPGHKAVRGIRSTRRAVVRMDAYPKPDQSATGSTLVGEGTAPMSGTTTPAGIPQKDVPLDERIAYLCNDCGYIYDQETPFEDLDDNTYTCPVCTAPKSRFTMQNLNVGEAKESNEDVQSIN